MFGFLFLFVCLLFNAPYIFWDLSSLTRDGAHGPSIEATEP